MLHCTLYLWYCNHACCTLALGIHRHVKMTRQFRSGKAFISNVSNRYHSIKSTTWSVKCLLIIKLSLSFTLCVTILCSLETLDRLKAKKFKNSTRVLKDTRYSIVWINTEWGPLWLQMWCIPCRHCYYWVIVMLMWQWFHHSWWHRYLWSIINAIDVWR